jgi:hypothetical protein
MYHHEQPSVALPDFTSSICNTFDHHHVVYSMVQICSAVTPVLPPVENLALEADYELWDPHLVIQHVLW